MIVRVVVSRLPGVLDPQGQAIGKALQGLGFSGVEQVRQGKTFDIRFADDQDVTDAMIDEMCQKLLVNTVIETYEILPSDTKDQSA